MQNEDLQRLRDTMTKLKLKNIRQPLEAALMTTPLILLAPVTVSSGRYGQLNMLRVSEGYTITRSKLTAGDR